MVRIVPLLPFVLVPIEVVVIIIRLLNVPKGVFLRADISCRQSGHSIPAAGESRFRAIDRILLAERQTQTVYGPLLPLHQSRKVYAEVLPLMQVYVGSGLQ